MKTTVRGHRRIWRKIDTWIQDNQILDKESLLKWERSNVKFRIFPWNGFTRIKKKSILPEPKTITKNKILNGLFEIYDSWKVELDKLDEPYYLKIWLYQERFSNSQVVCALRNKINFYDYTFSKPDFNKDIEPVKFGNNKKIDDYHWELRLDEELFDNTFLGEESEYENKKAYLESKKGFENMLLKKHRKYKPENPTEHFFEIYAFEKGKLWVGEKKKNAQ